MLLQQCKPVSLNTSGAFIKPQRQMGGEGEAEKEEAHPDVLYIYLNPNSSLCLCAGARQPEQRPRSPAR